MFKLSVIDKCSYCPEQSYLLGLVHMVTPQYSWMGRERMYVRMCVCTRRFVLRMEGYACS